MSIPRQLARPEPCEVCGELIRVPVPRGGAAGPIICEQCWTWRPQLGGVSSEAEKHDRTYHGGRFREGEW